MTNPVLYTEYWLRCSKNNSFEKYVRCIYNLKSSPQDHCDLC